MLPSTESVAFQRLQDGFDMSDESSVQHQLEIDTTNDANFARGDTVVLNKMSRAWWRQILHHSFGLHVALLVLIIVDFILAVAGEHGVVTILLSSIFVIEVTLRAWAFGLREYFVERFQWRGCINSVDALAVAISFILACADSSASGYVAVIRLVRVLRVFRVATRVAARHEDLRNTARNVVSENKQRFVGDGFDLDLVYVTPRVIGMSVPAEGKEKLYRNDAREVARFFNTKHMGAYWLYNLCIEREYDTTQFESRVSRIPVVDHSVPRLTTLFAFCRRAAQFLDSDENNVIAVHCRGGKGRTGTFVCAWLIYRWQKDVVAALSHFAQRRTDRTKGTKVQGVQTPSQSRYVAYFEKWLQMPLLAHGRESDVLAQQAKLRFHSLVLGPFDQDLRVDGHADDDLFRADMSSTPVPFSENALLTRLETQVERSEDLEADEENNEDEELRLLSGQSQATGNAEARPGDFVAELLYWPLETDTSKWMPTSTDDLRTLSCEPGPAPQLLFSRVCDRSNFPRAVSVRADTEIPLQGDVQLRFFRVDKKNQQKLLCSCFLHTSFVELDARGRFHIPKLRLDRLHKDGKHKKLPPHFALYVQAEQVHE